jgi:hypothetical protein
MMAKLDKTDWNWSADSYLGTEPICDNCKRAILPDEKVTQTFTGYVMHDTESNEFGILETEYTLIHVNCFNPFD